MFKFLMLHEEHFALNIGTCCLAILKLTGNTSLEVQPLTQYTALCLGSATGICVIEG